MDVKWYRDTHKLNVRDQWDSLYNIKSKCRDGRPSIWSKSRKVFFNSAALVETLPNLFKEFNVKSFIDIGCSDFVWMAKIDWADIEYTGFDIVQRIIDSNKIEYPYYKFECKNLIVDTCPTADFVFIRSVFIHSSLNDCQKIIENVKSSGSKYLMASTSPEVDRNEESACLKVQKRNLTAEPFNFPVPLYLMPEMIRADGVNNYMGVWRIDDLNTKC